MLDIRRVPADHPDAVAMVAAVQQVYVERYGGGDLTPVGPGDFDPPRGCFFVGYLHGQAVAGGGWRAWGTGIDPPLRDGDAEIKRMYVADAHRGRGFARAVLAELERGAAAAGCLRTVLETGPRQPEAIALYTSSGYTPITPFGIYREHPGCRCFAKVLTRRGLGVADRARRPPAS